jgi:ATP-binding cassette subfamily C protein CydD
VPQRILVVVLAWVQAVALAGFYILLGRLASQLGYQPMAQLASGDLILLVVLALVAGTAAWAVPFLAARDQATDEAAEHRRVVAQVFRLGAAQRSRERSGAIVSTATDGVERAAAYRGTFLAPMIGSMTAPLLVLAMMGALIDWTVAAWTAIALPVIPLALGGFQRAFSGVSRRYRENGRLFAAKFLDAIQGLPTLRLMNAEKAHGRELAKAAEELRRHVMRLLAGNQLMLFVVDSLFSIAFVAVVAALALWRLSSGTIDHGEALALVLCGTLLLDPLDRIGQFFYIGMGGIASAKEIKTLLAASPKVLEAADPQVPEINLAAPAVELRDVSFAYGAAARPAADSPEPSQSQVLNSFNLAIAPGEHVAMIGPSGAGKTTIAELLQGNLRPNSGQVCLFGADTASTPLAWQRAQLSVVAQHTYLFTGTLRDNLAVADPLSDDARLLQALEAADLGAFLTELPDGLDTMVGERGLALSGGQSQRIGIARAFLKDAPILVLDEPTAHVDLASERAILEALRRIGADKTVIAISHRRATIVEADRVIEIAGAVR